MAFSDHPQYARLQTFVNNLVIKTRNKQADYFVQKRRYFQGLRTPQGKIDGTTLEEIGYGLHPSDQDDSWNSFDKDNYNVSTKVPAHISLDVYESPEGWGWRLKVEVQKDGLDPDAYGTDGNRWVWKHNEGPGSFTGVWNEWYIEAEGP